MAWNMDANYGKMVNNLLNKEKPPMDENGNYIINAGSRSEKRIPKAEFEAQQKNAPTQTDAETLAKLLTEREANRLSAAQQGSQSPEPYNPRVEWLNNAMQNSMNRKTPLTAEEFLKQMGGLSSLGITPEQLKQQMEDWKPYGSDSGSFKSDPALEAKVAALNIPKRNTNAPAPDVDTPKAIGPKSAGGNYKDGQVVTQNGIRYIAHGGKLLTQAEVVKDKNLFNKYSNLVSNAEIGDANGPPPAVATDNSVISAPGGGKPPVKPVGVNPANDPNNLPYNNPESNRPIFPTSYSGQISLPTDPTEIQLMDYLKKQFEDKTWENKYGELQKQYQELADRPDKYSGMIEKAGGEDVAGYIKSLYEGSADPLRREAQRMQEQNAADLASRGLGMSTVVNDVNSGVQRELLANLTDLSNRSNVQGRDMYLNALRSAADVYGQAGAQKGNILNAMQTNIGNQMGAQQIGLANINDILAKQEARRLTNMQTGINQWDKDVANYWKYQYYPIDAYAGQNSTAATAASVGGQVYNQANTNAAGQNQLVGDVGATLAKNLFKQPQNSSWVPVGGLSGAQQGGTTGFSTKPKTGAWQQ